MQRLRLQTVDVCHEMCHVAARQISGNVVNFTDVERRLLVLLTLRIGHQIISLDSRSITRWRPHLLRERLAVAEALYFRASTSAFTLLSASLLASCSYFDGAI